MKRIAKIRFLLSKNKQARRALALVCLVFLLVGGILASVKMLDEKERVSAHPTNPITIADIDGDTDKDFSVPIDGKKKIEYSTGYDDFLQTEDNIPALSKQISDTEYASTTLFSSQISNSVIGSFITANDNIITMQSFTTYPYGAGYNRINQTKIILQSKTGDVLDTKWVHNTPNPITEESGVKQTLYNKFFQKSGTEFLALYSITGSQITTTTYVDEGNQLGILSSDNDQVVDISSIDLEGQSIQNHWVNSSNNNMSSTIMYGTAREKSYYNVIEHNNGSVIDVYKFDTAPDVPLNVVSYPGHYSIITDTFVIDENTVVGMETLYTTSGNYRCLSRWDINHTTKTATRTEILREETSSFIMEKSISDNNDLYVQLYRDTLIGETQVEILKINPLSRQIDTVQTFPKLTRLRFSKQQSGYFYAGQIREMTGSLEGIGTQEGIYSGYMDSSFDWRGSSAIRLEFPGRSSVTSITSFEGNQDLFILSGVFTTEENFFIDEVVYGNYPGEVSTGSNKEWSEQTYSPMKGNVFVSILSKNEDWAPLIKPPAPFDVGISDADFSATDQSAMDRWLLTGSKNGSFDDPGSTEVYDTFDIDEGLNTYDISWLRERINKNPKKLVYDASGRTLQSSDRIDWLALGFDKEKAGPQLVSYFVTDSQNQTSTTSQWINGKTDQTIEEDEYCLDAQNFHIPLTGLDTAIPDDATFKELAKTMAWNKTSSDIDEDGTDSSKLSTKVTIDTTQLQALRDATEAKPYPVDVVYNAKSGVSITNRVWVFVTEKNTVPNSDVTPNPITPADTNGVVIYANDYSLPYRMRNTHTNLEAVTSADVKVYDYFDSTHETDDELPSLADATKNASEITVDLQTIQDATEPETVRPSVSYTWQGTTDANHTNGTAGQTFVDVELTGNALLHIRQVVLDASNEIVVPTVGYFEVRNLLFDQTNPMNPPVLDPDYLATFTGKSGSDISNNEFTSVVVPTSHIPNLADQLEITVVVPEFYQYLGYWCTTEEADPGGAFHLTNTDYIDLPLDIFKGEVNDVGEYWITMFIKPNVDDNDNIKTPQPYSWDYKKNDLGKIKTK